MNLRRPSNEFQRRGKRLPIAFFVVGVIVVLFIIGNTLSLGGFSRITQNVVRPLWKVGGVAGGISASISNIFSSRDALREENTQLREEITRLQLREITAGVIAQENNELRGMFGRAEHSEEVVGAIIARPNHSPYDTFIIDIGWEYGVKTGAPVFAYGTLEIGSVVEVYAKTSLIQLHSSPGTTRDVLVGESAIPAQAVGKGGGNFEIELPRSVVIKEGDPVIAPSLDGGLLGTVSTVLLNATDPFQTILFRSPINIQTIRFVTISL